ncbi:MULTISPECIES: acetylxylan esterase [Streptomyces]|uniref:Acetylxylan esterase n=1 Tax=Streptomyces lycii TaxID=2654337 RepID=A0ABQ7FHX7_9ACTN|nr:MULTISPECIES: acetylxylan esterase [Streptomyces]KAF4408596.1 acetylxylan esterase [Streptomyces lycii]PGH49731.1 acetylxylan esterase [Streptomyces sp. Ru87]
MPLTDLPLEQLRDYRAAISEPEDFDAFWAKTLAEARDAADGATTGWRPVDDPLLATVDTYDVRFPGWGGQPVAAWLLLPRGAAGPLPGVVSYIGYGGGRGLSVEHLLFSAAGYAHLVVDSRGQGHDTPDPDPVPGTQWVRGYMTRGIDSPEHHYYRRLMTDCVRAVDALREHPAVDPARVVVAGASQGGGLALATAGLAGDAVAGALVDVPFLCHYRRGAEIASLGPYPELAEYLGRHKRVDPERVFGTLDYFDGVHFARRATAPALFSVAMMDPICPPSTVYAAHNAYAGEASMKVWHFADHAGGQAAQAEEQLRWLRGRGLAPSRT